jgi:hypothetical protein
LQILKLKKLILTQGTLEIMPPSIDYECALLPTWIILFLVNSKIQNNNNNFFNLFYYIFTRMLVTNIFTYMCHHLVLYYVLCKWFSNCRLFHWWVLIIEPSLITLQFGNVSPLTSFIWDSITIYCIKNKLLKVNYSRIPTNVSLWKN